MFDKDKIKNKINQLKSQKQYKETHEAELREIAEKYLLKKELKAEAVYLDEEIGKAVDLFFDYKKSSYIEHISEYNDLKRLIFLEIYSKRLEKQISDIEKKTKSNPKHQMDDYMAVLEQIKELKSSLGLLETEKQGFEHWWEQHKKKLQKYAETHRGAFTFKCPHCQQMTLLLRRVENFETIPFKMFEGTVLYNEPLLRFMEQGKLTKEEVAEVWGLPRTDYIEVIFKKLYLPKKKGKGGNSHLGLIK